MTFEDFEILQKDIFLQCSAMANTKGREYSRTVERFANFKRIAEKNKKLNPLDVCQIFLAKHIDGIDSFVENGRTFSEERIYGRIVDAIVYMTLMYGLIQEAEFEELKLAQGKVGVVGLTPDKVFSYQDLATERSFGKK